MKDKEDRLFDTTITVREFIAALEKLPQDHPVRIGYPYGDRPNTIVTVGIAGAEEEEVVWSEYHRDFKLASERDSDEESYEAVVIR